MDGRIKQIGEYQWQIDAYGRMNVPAVIFGSRRIIDELEPQAITQIVNVATLPGIVRASFAMPDAHQGYGFPIGGVAAFDPQTGGVISGGGVGFDIACGVRTLNTGLVHDDVQAVAQQLAEAIFRIIPAGVGSTGNIGLNRNEMDDMLAGGAEWAVEQGYGSRLDLEYIEENGRMSNAKPGNVSDEAKRRQTDEMGTLGAGNHYLEVQKVVEIYDSHAAPAYGLKIGSVVVSIHCGSRGLGHQIGTDYLKQMAKAAASFGIELADKELACVPAESPLGKDYIGAMYAGINCAMANRQILTELVRRAFAKVLPKAHLSVLYEVCHNTAKMEKHNGKMLLVHRKGATRSLGPGDERVPAKYRDVGQPVLIGGSMGTCSYILAGTKQSEALAFSSACHGAGRALSRTAAKKRFRGSEIIKSLGSRAIIIKAHSMSGLAEEAPDAYKDVDEVVEAAHQAGLARKVARLEPLICIKG